MASVLLLVMAFALVAALVIRLTLLFAERLMGRMVTEHFRAAEFILERHQAPESWMRSPRSATQPLLLERLDKLIAFFETCPYFEDEDSRTVLLGELRAEREKWQASPLDSLVGSSLQAHR